jgi:acetylornithine deacetylase
LLSCTELLATLVGFKTVSRDPNAAMIGFIAQTLRAQGGEVRVLPGKQTGKANLLARFGRQGQGGIVLSGHSDVVPVDGQDWLTDPFVLTARDGQLFGRGASDMKGFIASAIAVTARLDVKRLDQPLYLAISHDEEIGCVGVRTMLATLAAEGFAARGCIVGEPTGMRVATGHKGKFAGCICCRGEPAHSANPELGCNAIYLAASMVAELRELQQWLRANGARDAAYAVPYSTVNIGTVAGGTALNIVPERCDMAFEFRLTAGDMPAVLLARLRAAADRLTAVETARGRRATIKIVETGEYPGLETPVDDPIVGLASEASGTSDPCKVDFGTEGGLFDQTLGLPVVICGPGSIDRAHKPGEFVLRDELDRCDAFLDRVVAAL